MTTDTNMVATIKAATLPMRRIELRDDIQPRSRTSPDAIGRYAALIKNAQATKTKCPLPPIWVWREPGSDKHIVIDGYHRYRAHEQERVRKIEARVIPCADMAEARWLATQANLTHGVPMRRKDHREMFRRYIEARKHRDSEGKFKGYRATQSELGGIASLGTIWKWIREDFPKLATEAGQPECDAEDEQSLGQETLSHDMRHMQDYGRGVKRTAGDSFKRFGQRDREDTLSILGEIVFDTAMAIGDTEVSIIQALMDRRPSVILSL